MQVHRSLQIWESIPSVFREQSTLILPALSIRSDLTQLLIQQWKQSIKFVILLLLMNDAVSSKLWVVMLVIMALWCGIANGAEDVLIPEKYDYDEQKLINNIIASRKAGKKHHIIVNAEGIGHSQAMAKRIEAATGIETRATILGHMQRGGSPTCKDRVYASMMGALAVDLLIAGKSCRVVGYKHGEFVDFDINEALAMQKDVSPYMWEVCNSLSHNYKK